MNSRVHCSELALADLGCAHIRGLENSKVLVGGLGMGFTLAATLKATYHAILLDVDNGPEGFTQADNNSLYSLRSLQAIRQMLHPGGVLAVWSA
jgi:spermidine synthase